MDLKNNELKQLKTVVAQVAKASDNAVKLKLMLNEELIDSRIAKLKELGSLIDGIKDFQNDYMEAISEYVEKDEAGNVILYSGKNGTGKVVETGFPNIIKPGEDFNAARDTVMDKYKSELKEQSEKDAKFTKTLSENVDPVIEFYKIKFSDLPESDMNEWYDYIKVIKPMLEYEDEL